MPAPPPPTPSDPTRYTYLVSRLRNRQITMEEATELFALQQSMIRANARLPPPPNSAAVATPAPPSALGVLPPVSDDTVWLTLLAMGAGAGVLAAVLKRARDGPDGPTRPLAPTTASRSGTRPSS